jgi:hypothetical protein
MNGQGSGGSGFQSGALKDGFVRILGRIQRIKSFRDGNSSHDNLADFILHEIGDLEADLELLAKSVGLDLDMEAKNIREIEALVTRFVAKTFQLSDEESLSIARNLLTVKPSEPISTSSANVREAVVTIDARYEQNDPSTWTRSVDVWYLSDKKPKCYTADSVIPRDELPPAVREQSITSAQKKFSIRLYPSE